MIIQENINSSEIVEGSIWEVLRPTGTVRATVIERIHRPGWEFCAVVQVQGEEPHRLHSHRVFIRRIDPPDSPLLRIDPPAPSPPTPNRRPLLREIERGIARRLTDAAIADRLNSQGRVRRDGQSFTAADVAAQVESHGLRKLPGRGKPSRKRLTPESLAGLRRRARA